jgi:hypothetical protein
MLGRDLRKGTGESGCGRECDFDGDGQITRKDERLMEQLCDSPDCSFAAPTYSGAPTPLEPNMRAVRRVERAAFYAFVTAHPEDKECLSGAEEPTTGTAAYNTELKRKEGLRSIRYYYKGTLVDNGCFAQWQEAAAGKPTHFDKAPAFSHTSWRGKNRQNNPHREN